jgi:hypothetical protein
MEDLRLNLSRQCKRRNKTPVMGFEVIVRLFLAYGCPSVGGGERGARRRLFGLLSPSRRAGGNRLAVD